MKKMANSKTKKQRNDNKSNQKNPNNNAYYQSRGHDSKDDHDDQQHNIDDYEDEEVHCYEEDGDSFDPDEESPEYEDMPGDNADEREEYYDNNF